MANRKKITGRTYRIEAVGTVRFERSRKARRINISVKPFRGIRVAVPEGTSYEKARAFAHAKKGWILKHLEKMHRLEAMHREIARTFQEIDKQEARHILSRRLDELAASHGFTYNRLFVRNQRSRWGSCSAKNNISLNVKLTRLPRELMDYVILHELVHTRIPNHSRAFYAELDRRVAGRESLEVRLRAYEAGMI